MYFLSVFIVVFEVQLGFEIWPDIFRHSGIQMLSGMAMVSPDSPKLCEVANVIVFIEKSVSMFYRTIETSYIKFSQTKQLWELKLGSSIFLYYIPCDPTPSPVFWDKISCWILSLPSLFHWLSKLSPQNSPAFASAALRWQAHISVPWRLHWFWGSELREYLHVCTASTLSPRIQNKHFVREGPEQWISITHYLLWFIVVNIRSSEFIHLINENPFPLNHCTPISSPLNTQ